MLRLMGWRVENAPPDLAKMVIVVAPHTSNWDFPVGVAAMFALDLGAALVRQAHALPRAVRRGAAPHRRRARAAPRRRRERQRGARSSRSSPPFAAAGPLRARAAPRGDARPRGALEVGLLRDRRGRGVPVVPAWLDWSRRVVGFGAPARAEGGAEAMSARLAASFHPRMARRPDAY
jgi:hypothetical protein